MCSRIRASSRGDAAAPTRSVSSSTASTTAWNSSLPYIAIHRA